MIRLQSSDRVHRPGQTNPVSYFDVMAVGPKGQNTIERVIIKSLRDKEILANWTTDAWRDALRN
jgi:SNF2 family DNA or RNA helicase